MFQLLRARAVHDDAPLAAGAPQTGAAAAADAEEGEEGQAHQEQEGVAGEEAPRLHGGAGAVPRQPQLLHAHQRPLEDASLLDGGNLLRVHKQGRYLYEL